VIQDRVYKGCEREKQIQHRMKGRQHRPEEIVWRCRRGYSFRGFREVGLG